MKIENDNKNKRLKDMIFENILEKLYYTKKIFCKHSPNEP